MSKTKQPRACAQSKRRKDARPALSFAILLAAAATDSASASLLPLDQSASPARNGSQGGNHPIRSDPLPAANPARLLTASAVCNHCYNFLTQPPHEGKHSDRQLSRRCSGSRLTPSAIEALTAAARL